MHQILAGIFFFHVSSKNNQSAAIGIIIRIPLPLLYTKLKHVKRYVASFWDSLLSLYISSINTCNLQINQNMGYQNPRTISSYQFRLHLNVFKRLLEYICADVYGKHGDFLRKVQAVVTKPY